jgi:hypothetical protein
VFAFDIVDFYVFEIGVCTYCQVGRKCPRSRCPSKETCFGI